MDSRRGFSMVELAVAAAMVGILAGALLWTMGGEVDETRIKLAKGQLDSLARRLTARSQTRPDYHFVDLAEGLGEAPPLDPWGRPVFLVHPTRPAPGDQTVTIGTRTYSTGAARCPKSMLVLHYLVGLGPPREGDLAVPTSFEAREDGFCMPLRLGAPGGGPGACPPAEVTTGGP
jgi:prepilin-type N-terminal cleavage/methylation domain-containing protein